VFGEPFLSNHTSADNLEFIRPDKLAEYRSAPGLWDVLKSNYKYRNESPYCEPQLRKRGLYRSTGGESIDGEINARLGVLNLSDSDHSLLDIAEPSHLPLGAIRDAADLLRQGGLRSKVH